MIGDPRIEHRPERRTVGIRSLATMDDLQALVPRTLDEVFGWLGARGLEPDGAPYMRYHVIDMAGEMDVEVGVPLASAAAGEGAIVADVIPAGRYASLVYSGVDPIDANRALIEWARDSGLEWDRWDDPRGDAFGARVEWFLTNPDQEPDPEKWETEVAIRLADS